jgi:hypothetical protein
MAAMTSEVGADPKQRWRLRGIGGGGVGLRGQAG